MCIVKVINNTYGNEKDLENLVNYVIQPSHCKCGLYGATAMNVGNVADMVNSMKVVKKEFKKPEGRQLLHIVVSFDDKDESWVTPQIAYELGYRFAALYLNGQQTVFGVHDNTDNLHIHIVLNSVSYVTGLKYGIPLDAPNVMRYFIHNLMERYYLKKGIEMLE